MGKKVKGSSSGQIDTEIGKNFSNYLNKLKIENQKEMPKLENFFVHQMVPMNFLNFFLIC